MPEQPPNDRVGHFHERAGKSHAEARKLLTGLSVGSLGVLYATLAGRTAPALDPAAKWLAVAVVIAMALAAGCGLAAWRADAAWAYRAAVNFEKDPLRAVPDGGVWHGLKKGCDLLQIGLFAIGLSLAALLTLRGL